MLRLAYMKYNSIKVKKFSLNQFFFTRVARCPDESGTVDSEGQRRILKQNEQAGQQIEKNEEKTKFKT